MFWGGAVFGQVQRGWGKGAFACMAFGLRSTSFHAGFRFSLGWVRVFGAEKSGAQISHQHIRNLSKI